MEESRETRVLVADNDARVRLALQTLLSQESGDLTIRESSDLGDLAAQVRNFRPDLVFLDWELPGRPAVALLFALHGLTYHPKVIILSTRHESEGEATAAGADAFICKADPPERLLEAFRRFVRQSRGEEQEG